MNSSSNRVLSSKLRVRVLPALALALLLAPAAPSVADWEAPVQIDEQGEGTSKARVLKPTRSTDPKDGNKARASLDLASDADGRTTVQFWQAGTGSACGELTSGTPESERVGSLMARRGEGNWSAPATVGLDPKPPRQTPLPPGSPPNDGEPCSQDSFFDTALGVAPGGRAVSQTTYGGDPKLYGGFNTLAVAWPASDDKPRGQVQGCPPEPRLVTCVAPQVGVDAEGNGYAVMALTANDAAPDSRAVRYATCCSATGWGSWDALPFENKDARQNDTFTMGHNPRIAVAPDGTVVVGFLRCESTGDPAGEGAVTCRVVVARKGAGATEFKIAHTVSTGRNASGDFDVAIDGSGVATIVYTERPGQSPQPAVFARRWLLGRDPSGPKQLSTSLTSAASNPRVVADAGGRATVAWIEGGILTSAEFFGGKWTVPDAVSTGPVSAGGYDLTVDRAGTATAVWIDNGSAAPPKPASTQAARRATGLTWSDPVTLSLAEGAVAGLTARVAAPYPTTANSLTGRADAVWIQHNGTRDALFASRFTGSPPVTPEVGIAGPAPAAPPGQESVTRKRPGLTLRTTPRRNAQRPYRFTTTGRIRLPQGVSESEGCSGEVRVAYRFARAKRALAKKTVPVGSDCKFRLQVSFDLPRPKETKHIKFSGRFGGNQVLRPRRSLVRTVFIQ